MIHKIYEYFGEMGYLIDVIGLNGMGQHIRIRLFHPPK